MAWAERRGRYWRVRYRLPDWSYGSQAGFETKAEALEFGRGLELDLRRGKIGDPRRGMITLGDWVPIWWGYQHVSEITAANYEYRLGRILEFWGGVPLSEIQWLGVRSWALQLKASPRTIADLMSMFSSLLSSAVDDGRLDRNVLYGRRLRRSTPPKERAWVTPEQALAIADATLRNQDRLMILTAMWTGMRWGELAGLHRDNCGLLRRSDGVRRAVIHVDAEMGALHEDPRTHRLWLGPPKPPNGAREVDLPPFLADLLAQYLASHPSPYPFVFASPNGKPWQRTAFTRRVLRPALRAANLSQFPIAGVAHRGEVVGTVDQVMDLPRDVGSHHPGRSTSPSFDSGTVGHSQQLRLGDSNAAHGLTFHGLRHSHKTLLIELGIPEVLQCERLGHAQPGVPGLYSHVAGPVRQAMLHALQARWERPIRQAGTG